MLDVTFDTFECEVAGAGCLAVVDFSAGWCAPCRALGPILEELEREYPDVKFCRVDVDREPALARDFNVRSVPTVLLIKNEMIVNAFVGFRKKEDIVSLLEFYKDRTDFGHMPG